MKILIVEDEEIMLKQLTERFTGEKFEIVTARDGEEGLKLALTERPDLILLDIILPKMDGMTMMKKLRQMSSWGKKVPIIILTNLNANDSIMKGVTENEPAYYLTKTSWTIDEVLTKVKEQLGVK